MFSSAGMLHEEGEPLAFAYLYSFSVGEYGRRSVGLDRVIRFDVGIKNPQNDTLNERRFMLFVPPEISTPSLRLIFTKISKSTKKPAHCQWNIPDEKPQSPELEQKG